MIYCGSGQRGSGGVEKSNGSDLLPSLDIPSFECKSLRPQRRSLLHDMMRSAFRSDQAESWVEPSESSITVGGGALRPRLHFPMLRHSASDTLWRALFRILAGLSTFAGERDGRVKLKVGLR